MTTEIIDGTGIQSYEGVAILLMILGTALAMLCLRPWIKGKGGVVLRILALLGIVFALYAAFYLGRVGDGGEWLITPVTESEIGTAVPVAAAGLFFLPRNLNKPIGGHRMNRKRKTKLVIAGALASSVLLGAASCESAADTANTNLTKACENFECPRRIVGVNTITDSVLWSVEGFCSYETPGGDVEVICLVDRATGEVNRTTMGGADNVTFVSTQLEGVDVDLFQPRVIFRPEGIVPDFDLSTSARLQGNGNG